MKKFVIALFAAGVQGIFAQVPTIQWQKNIGGSDSEDLNSIRQTLDGGYIVGGFTYSNNFDVSGNHGLNDLWIAKLNSSGILEWQKTIGGSGFDFNCKVAQTANGGYIAGGSTQSVDGDAVGSHGGSDILIARLNASGEILWRKMLGGSGNDYFGAVSPTSGGGFIIAGSTQSNDGDVTTNHGMSDLWIVKLNSDGEIEWEQTFGGSNVDGGTSVVQTSDGGYIAAGSTRSTNGDVSVAFGSDDIWIVKLSDNGAIEWDTSLGGSLSDGYADVKIAAEGGYYVSGTTYSNNGIVSGNHGDSDAWIVKLNALGAVVWQRTFGGTGTDGTYSLAADSNGGCIFAGFTNSLNGNVTQALGSYDVWVAKVSGTGTLMWQKSFGGTGYELGTAITETSDNGFAFAAGTNSITNDVLTNFGLQDGWVVKLTPENLSTPQFAQNSLVVFPNPAKSELNIQFDGDAICCAFISDINGQKVLEVTAGNTINIEGLATGMYVVSAQAGGQELQQKFIKR